MEQPVRSLKLLFAIARGSWVISPAWLIGSIDRRRWLQEELFENSTFVGCRMARVNRERDGPTLFRGLHVLVTPGTQPESEVIEEMIYLAGANIVMRIEDAAVVIATDYAAWSSYRQHAHESGPGSRHRGQIIDGDGSLQHAGDHPPHDSQDDHRVVVTPKWIFECLTQFMIVHTGPYQVANPNTQHVIQLSPQL